MCKPTYKQIDKIIRKGEVRCLESIRVADDICLHFESCKDIDKLILDLRDIKKDLRDTFWMIHHCSYKHIMCDIANMHCIKPPHICPPMVYRSP